MSSPMMYRMIAVDPRTTRCLVLEGAAPGMPARLWLVTPLWKRPIAPSQLGEMVVLRRGWVCDLYTAVPSFAEGRDAALEVSAWYRDRVQAHPLEAREDHVRALKIGVSPRRSIAAFLSRRARQVRVGRAHALLNRAHSALFVTVPAKHGEAVRQALIAARYRVEGKVPPPPPLPITDEQRERIRSFVDSRKRKAAS
jgi:hypothetical protein